MTRVPRPREITPTDPLCKWPHKQQFATKAKARKQTRTIGRGSKRKGRLQPFWCYAGHWHVGSQHR